MPVKSSQDLPSTLRRSPAKAQRTYAKSLNSAEEQYGPGERAQRTAYSSLKHSFERKGNRWVPKERKGPSDPRAKHPEARRNKGKSFGGVDFYGNTKRELYERARELGVQGRSGMSKEQLAEAIARKQR